MTSATTKRQEYTQHVYRTILHDGQVHLYEFETMLRQELDVFFDQFTPILHEWDSEKPYLMVFDLTHSEISFSPYFKRRAYALIPVFVERDIRGKRALVVRKNVVGRILNAFSKGIQIHSQQRIQARTFFDRQEALRWIAEDLD